MPVCTLPPKPPTLKPPRPVLPAVPADEPPVPGFAGGALTLAPMTEVTGIDIVVGRVKRVRTDRGDIEAEVVVIACGVWSPKLARMAGAQHAVAHVDDLAGLSPTDPHARGHSTVSSRWEVSRPSR